MSLVSLLPGPDVQENLRHRWSVLVSRVICKYLTEFQHLRKCVISHIPHKYSHEMVQKSVTVSDVSQ